MIDRKKLGWFVFLAFLSIALDQCLKFYILELASNNNPIFKSEIIDIVLVFNRGVAFSLGSILGDYLKWIILAMLCFMLFIINGNIFLNLRIKLKWVQNLTATFISSHHQCQSLQCA